jgi:hypothetical protein
MALSGANDVSTWSSDASKWSNNTAGHSQSVQHGSVTVGVKVAAAAGAHI